jgi:hypothetical protein
MKSLKKLALAATAATTLAAFICAGTASATTLEVGGVKQNLAVSLEATLASGTSVLWKAGSGTTADTCTGSTIKAKTEGTFTGASVGGKVSSLSFTGCSHTTDVINNGSLSIAWTSGTNGTITSSGTEVTIKNTVFGISLVCKTGAGITIGTITGVASGHATIHINTTTLQCFDDVSWTGTYTVTSPTGLGVVS